jgi:hypothetical protein
MLQVYILVVTVSTQKGDTIMKTASNKLRSSVTALRQSPVAEIKAVFDTWLRVPEGFGNPDRIRLFSPLAHLLALPLSGSLT